MTAVNQGRGFIYHLCEGSDPALLQECRLVEGVGLVHRLLIAIHGTALQQAQLDALAAVGRRWCGWLRSSQDCGFFLFLVGLVESGHVGVGSAQTPCRADRRIVVGGLA